MASLRRRFRLDLRTARHAPGRVVGGLAVALSLAASTPAAAELIITDGAICDPTVWNPADKKVSVNVAVSIGNIVDCPTPSNARLDIAAGVEVQFAKNLGINVVQGELRVLGTALAPVMLTAKVKAPTPERWNGIRFFADSNDATFDGGGNYVSGSILRHAIVEYAQDDAVALGAISTDGVSPYLSNVTVRQSALSQAAVRMKAPGKTCRITDSMVQTIAGPPNPGYIVYLECLDSELAGVGISGPGSASYGIYATGTLTIDRSTIQGGTSYGISTGGSLLILRDSSIEDVSTGLLTYSGTSTVSLQRNTIRNCGSRGIAITGFSSLLVEDSQFLDNANTGILLSQFYTPALATIRNNLFARNGGNAAIQVGDYYAASGSVASSANCFTANSRAFYFESGSTTLRNDTLVDQVNDGMLVLSNALADIQDSNVYQTAGFALRNQRAFSPTGFLTATNNAWGRIEGNGSITTYQTKAEVDSHVEDDDENPSYEQVKLIPLSTTPRATAPDIDACRQGLTPGTTSTTSTSTSTTLVPTTTLLPTTTLVPTTTSSTSTLNTTTSHTTTSSTVTTTSKTSTSMPATTTTAPTIPTTTSTSSPASSTSSSTSTTPATSSSTSSTMSPPSTTTSTTTSGSTTTTLRCGNGEIDPGEECDPKKKGSEECCIRETCLPYNRGKSCGFETDACGPPVCDGKGVCVTKPAYADLPCRDPGSNGACDPGAICREDQPHCPEDDLTSGCQAEKFRLTAGAKSIRFRCRAPRSQFGGLKCEAELSASGVPVERARKARPRDLDAIPASDCTGAQLNQTVPKKLATASRTELARYIVTKVNKDDRDYLAPGKTICVRVTFTGKNEFQHTRLYSITIPLDPSAAVSVDRD